MSQTPDVQPIIEDVSYLVDELEALKSVIQVAPYQERPPGAVSILDMLARIREQQEQYYKPLIEAALTGESTENIQPVSENYTEDNQDINEVLNSVIEKRKTYAGMLDKLTEQQWQKPADTFDTVASVVQNQIEFDRSILKEIAESVLTLDKSRSTPQQ